MKVNRRGASSPSLLLEGSEPPTSVNVNGNYYQFELEPHHVEKGKRGQKVFVCDLCPPPNGIFKRSFSLKRHYLRFHINFAFLSPRDLNNCAIALAGQHQRSGFPASGVINRLSSSSPLLYRCHQCGCLLRTKNDLLKHLETHPGSTSNGTEEFINDDHRGTNRCPRCSTAFSLRKTLMRHIKKNRCRGGGPTVTAPPSKNEPEMGVPSVDASDQCDESNLSVREEESEEMDMEASLRLGCPTSLFRFACTLCAKMFNSYVNMCRHRRLAHGRYGICSPHWLLSRKLSGKSMLNHAVPSPVISSTKNLQNSQDLSHFVQNANENLTQFLHGKIVHIQSTVSPDNRFDVPEVGDPAPDRWSWKENNYNIHELQKLDVPLQQAYYRGLQLWKQQEAAKTEDSSSQAEPERMDISSALNLRPSETVPSVKVETDLPKPELSGEWIRSKSYICVPCGYLFEDFLALLNHQQVEHSGVLCSHIQLDQFSETGLAEELIRQIKRSGSGGSTQSSTAFQCTKCHFTVQSIPELHSHILLCSNHVSASPSRKRRFKVNPSSRRSHWSQNAASGRSRGMQRTISSQSKNSSAVRSLRSRSPKEEVDDDTSGNKLRRSARRVLSFNEQPPSKKKKKNATVTKRVLRQRVDPPRADGATPKIVQPTIVKKKATPTNKKPSVPVIVDENECDGCQKKFQSRTSVLKHKYYCPNKTNETINEASSRTPTPPPSKLTVNGQLKNKTKSKAQRTPTQESAKVQDKLGWSNSKDPQQSKEASSSQKKKSKTPVPSRSNGTHLTPKTSDTKKKLAKHKNQEFLTPQTPLSPVKSSKNSKAQSKKSPKSKLKSPKTAAKKKAVAEDDDDDVDDDNENGVEEEVIEPVEITGVTGRPVRSSRKASMSMVMEEQVEASFLEALSPEQRIRVAEQRCPFCSKHYVYRSNFKKHLVEGCDTADTNEPSINLMPTLKKPLVDEKRNGDRKAVGSPESRIAKKETCDKLEVISKKVEKSPEKKTLNQVDKEKSIRKATVPSRKTEKNEQQTTKPVRHVPQEKPKMSVKTVRKAATINEASPKLASKFKKTTDKVFADLGKKAMNRNNGMVSEIQSSRLGKGLKPKIVDKAVGKKSFFSQKKNGQDNSSKSEELTDSSNSVRNKSPALLTNGKCVTKNMIDSEDDCKLNPDDECLDSEPINSRQVIREIHENAELSTSLCGTNGTKETNTEENCCQSNNLLSAISIQKDRELGWEVPKLSVGNSPKAKNGDLSSHELPTLLGLPSDCKKSHALDKLHFGRALDSALRSGMLKSYASLTKYPMRIRQLEAMAQVYCQSKATDVTCNFDSST